MEEKKISEKIAIDILTEKCSNCSGNTCVSSVLIKRGSEEIGILETLKKGEKGIYIFHNKGKEYVDFSTLWLMEFKEYEFIVTNPEWRLIKIGTFSIRNEKLLITGDGENKKIITKTAPFTNYIGKSKMLFQKGEGGEPVSLDIEVISEKLFGEEEETPSYPVFIKALISEIEKKLVALPFNVETPVTVPSSEVVEPVHPIFKVFFFKNNYETLRSALSVIWHNPFRVLSERTEFVNISEVYEVTEDTIHSILTHSEYLVKTKKGIISSRRSSEKYTPLKVLQAVREETMDTPENRFVKFFVSRMLCDLEEVICRLEEMIKKTGRIGIRKG